MLIQTIQFEIHNAKENRHEEFLIENTEENVEKVLAHRFTRSIRFVKEFDFDYYKKMNMPIEFIDSQILAAVILENTKEMEAVA